MVNKGDDIAELIVDRSREAGIGIRDGDVIVVTQKIVSKSEGNVVDPSQLTPSPFAIEFSKHSRKDEYLIELILRESKSIVRMNGGNLITETKHGFICANSGVDRSNVDGGRSVTTLPKDSDMSAKRIREGIAKLTGKNVAVIISDSQNRPLRRAAVNVAIGISGMRPIRSCIGKRDLFSYELKTTKVAVADELASAAELIMGQDSEGIPVVIVRGYEYIECEDTKATELMRARERRLFR